MSIIGSDDREIVTRFSFPYSAVTAVDIWNTRIGALRKDFIGTGITIAPNHVLTAAHNAYANADGLTDRTGEWRTTISSQEDEIDVRTLSGWQFTGDPAPNVPFPDFIANYNLGESFKDDIALFRTTDAPLEANEVMGLITFVDPQDAIGIPVETAGYPGDNVESDIDNNTGQKGRDLIRTSGEILDVFDIRRMRYDLDTARGQSGSGIWHTLSDRDNERVLGVHTDSENEESNGVLITTDLYNEINTIIKIDSGSDNADLLPENAIIGSKVGDTIVGTYRKERILGQEGNDTISGGDARDRLEGGEGNDSLKGEKGNDLITGGEGNDIINGGEGDNDVAVFLKPYSVLDEETETDDGYYDITQNYDYSQDENGVITIKDISENPTEGEDTLEDIEWARFIIDENSSSNIPSELPSTNSSRLIPLPLTDGVEKTEFIGAVDTTVNPNQRDLPTPPNVTISAPVAMLDGDVDYTLNISPYQPSSERNVTYIIDTSYSMLERGNLQPTKDAYTDLTNYFIDNELAEDTNFNIIQFSRNARTYSDLTAEQAISTIQSLITAPSSDGTKYNDALNQGFSRFAQSVASDSTNIAYFVADGKSQQNFFNPYDVGYHQDAELLRAFANVQAFGINDAPSESGAVTTGQINFVDSNQGVIVNDVANLSAELQKSGLAGSVASVNILLDGEVVETVTPDQLTDSPLGLTYEGSIDELDVSIDAENVITAEVVFTDAANLASTTVEHIVTTGESEVIATDGSSVDGSDSGDSDESDPFEREVDGSDRDNEITLGYVDRGANGGAGSDYIIGNRRDNIIDGGEGNDTIIAHEGNDTIITKSEEAPSF